MAENATDEGARRRHRLPPRSCGPKSRTAPSAPARPRCCTRTSTSPSGCCATWSPTTPRASSPTPAGELPEAQRLRPRIHAPGGAAPRRHYTGERPLFDLHGVEAEIEKALARRVDLVRRLPDHRPDRGDDHHRRQHRRLRRRRNFDDTIFKTNLGQPRPSPASCACATWAASSSSTSSTWRTSSTAAPCSTEFRKALARDHTKMTVNGFTSLGLVEMTRKRTRESLAHLLCEPCSTCNGRGEVKTARTVAYEILRELLREARQFNAREFACSPRPTSSTSSSRKNPSRWRCSPTSSTAPSRCTRRPATGRNSSTSRCIQKSIALLIDAAPQAPQNRAVSRPPGRTRCKPKLLRATLGPRTATSGSVQPILTASAATTSASTPVLVAASAKVDDRDWALRLWACAEPLRWPRRRRHAGRPGSIGPLSTEPQQYVGAEGPPSRPPGYGTTPWWCSPGHDGRF